MKLWSVIIVVLLFLSACQADVIIIKTEGVIAYDLVVRGINQYCKEKTTILNIKSDFSNEPQIAEQVNKSSARAFIVLGDEAADFASRTIKNKDLLYSMVLQAKKYNFNKKTSFGLDVLITIDQAFSYLKQIKNDYKTMGLIYEPGKNDIVRQYAEEIAKKENITLVTESIKNTQDVADLMNDVLPRVQAILILPSNITMTPEVITYISQKALEKNIPVIGLAEIYLQHGALFTVSINPIIVGSALGQAVCLLAKGEAISNMRVANLSYANVSLNLKVAEVLKLVIPAKMKENAYKTIK
jgi:ABC-type uncharacterized transport system substrate-binding protein